MKKIITDLTKLSSASEPVEFLTNTGIIREEGDEIVKTLKE